MNELAIIVDFDSEVSIYRQIAAGIRALVARGIFADGDHLPSVRQLGEMVGVNLNTVAKAYRILAHEGLVELRHGSGARIRLPGNPYREILELGEAHQLDGIISRMVLRGADRKQVEHELKQAVERFYTRPGR